MDGSFTGGCPRKELLSLFAVQHLPVADPCKITLRNALATYLLASITCSPEIRSIPYHIQRHSYAQTCRQTDTHCVQSDAHIRNLDDETSYDIIQNNSYMYKLGGRQEHST